MRQMKRKPIVWATAATLLVHGLGMLVLPTEHLRLLVSDIADAVLAGLAAVAAFGAARRGKDFARLVWRLMASAFVIWTLTQILWTYREGFGGAASMGPNATLILFFFAFTPFAFLVLVSSRGEDDRFDWKHTLDAAQVGIVAICAYLYLFYFPTQWETAQQTSARLLSSVFLLRNLLLSAALWLRVALSRSRREGNLFRYAAGFMTAYLIFSRLPTYARLYWNIGTGTLLDLGWTLPFAIYAVAVAQWDEPETQEERQPSRLRDQLAADLTPTLVPLLVLVMAAQIAKEQLLLASLTIVASFACYAVRLALTQHAQEAALEKQRQSEARFRLLFERNPQPIWVYDKSSLQFLEVNEAATRKYGYTRKEFLAMRVTEIQSGGEVGNLVATTMQYHAGVRRMEQAHATRDGQTIQAMVIAEPLEFAGADAELVIVEDLTERHRLEEQLQQAQKMEALGLLAGGIAHDFNNLLTVITGYSQVVLERMPADEKVTRDVQQIEVAANRATGLIRQLLSFSRRQVTQPRVLDLEKVVTGMEKMLRRFVGENVELSIRRTGEPGFIKADPLQMEQVLINLAVNARDAMGDRTSGGKLNIELQNVTLEGESAKDNPDVPPGRYVMLAVSDNGAGMEESVRTRIFEPFFTTKEGAGTGLGLSIVFSIVQKCGGRITVASLAGRGSIFRIFFPRVEQAVTAEAQEEPEAPKAGSETILVVEDDDGLRELARRVLLRDGYKVLDAGRSSDAEVICREHSGPIHLMLTDVVMPGAGGRELAARVTPIRPEMAVLFMSGYADEVMVRQGVEGEEMELLTKPFTPLVLSRKIREVLEKKAAGTRG